MCSLKIISHSEKETANLGTRLVHLLGPGDIVCLFGPLGAGKTILVKGMARGLGISKDQVISPSFVLIREYPSMNRQARGVRRGKTSITLYHLDLFRLKKIREILDLGYEEYFYRQGICVIEWAQRLAGFLPSEFLKIELRNSNKTKRVIRFVAKGKRYRKILQRLQTNKFLSNLKLPK